MSDAVKNLQEVQDFYNNAIKGKIGRREAKKRVNDELVQVKLDKLINNK